MTEPLFGQTTWIGTTASWNTAGNWNNGLPSATRAATFDNPTGGNYNLTFTGAGTAMGITFTTTGNPTSGYTINTSGQTLTVDGNGIANNSTFTQTFSGTGTVTVGAAQTWNAASGDLAFNMSTLTVSNTLTLSGASDIAVSSAVTLGATLTYSGSGTDSFSGTVALTNNRTVTNNGTGSLTLGAVNLSLSTTAHRLTVNGSGDTTINGVIANGAAATGNLAYSGTGSLTLTDLNTYSGATTISSGSLYADDNGAFGTSGVTLSGGTLTSHSSAITLSNTTTLSANATVSNVNLSGTFTENGASRTLTLDNATLSGVVNLSNNNTAHTLTVQVDSGSPSTISGVIQNGGTSAGGLTKTGADTLTLSGANSYTGTTNITNGTLVATSNTTNNAVVATSSLGAVPSVPGDAVNISGGATLDIGGATANNSVYFGAKLFSISGAGVGGNGAIINSSAYYQIAPFQSITLTGDATIGGGDGSSNTQNGRFDIRNGAATLNLGTNTLTKTGSNQVSVVGGTISGNGNIVVNQGEFAIQTSTSATGTGTFTFNNGTTLGLWANNGPVTTAMTFVGSNTVLNESGASTLGSNLTINGTTNFDIESGSQLTLTGQLIAGTGLGAKTIVLNGANSTTYSTANPFTGTLALGANETFNSTLNLAGGTLSLAGFNLAVDTLHITGNSTIDFGAGLASILNTTNFIIDPGVTLTIAGWTDVVDYFYAQNFSGASYNIRGTTPENQVAFNGFSSNSTIWLSYDHQVTPVPEPAIYGALITAAALALFFWQRRRMKPAPVVVWRQPRC